MPEDRNLDPTPEEDTPWEMFDSKNIHSARRTPDGTVSIRFKDKKTGQITGEYAYAGIPEELYEKMRVADSVGEFFHANIKLNPQFKVTKV